MTVKEGDLLLKVDGRLIHHLHWPPNPLTNTDFLVITQGPED